MKRGILKGVFFFILTSLLACDSLYGRPGVKEALVKDTVRKYLQALIKAYRDLNLEDIKKYAGEKEARKVEALVGLLGMKHEIMDSQLLELRFMGVKFDSPERARVNTRERWKYRYLNMRTREEVKPWKMEVYLMSYRLEKREGVWKVISSSILDRFVIEEGKESNESVE